MRRRTAILGISALLLVASACGGDDETPLETGSSVPSATGPASTAAPDTTVPTTDAGSTAPPPTVVPTPSSTAPPVPEPDPGPARTVPLGQAFTIAIGESVGVTGEGLTVTYRQFVSDNRCPIGVQCITAGNATIVVEVSKAGGSPADVTLNTTEGPMSGGYLGYTVELVLLARGSSPAATLRVS